MIASADLLISTEAGLYCPTGDFYVDPWLAVPRALITHAHSDHAVGGCGRYLTSTPGLPVLQARLGPEAAIDAVDYGTKQTINGVTVSFYPAGHILGSAQIRLEHRGQVWAVSGDYKLTPDRTCAPFEPIRCHTFITESTFGLPIYRWPPAAAVAREINDWWRATAADGRASLVFAYPLGKAQRLIAALDPSIGPIYCHGAVQRMNAVYRSAGIDLLETQHTGPLDTARDWSGALMVAPPLARGSRWMRRFGDYASAFVSGWMQVRGARRRRVVERGFVFSDHADWPQLNEAIRGTGAGRILVTHGAIAPMVQWLREQGLAADPLATRFEGEQDETGNAPDDLNQEPAA